MNGIVKVFCLKFTKRQEQKIREVFNETMPDCDQGLMVGIEPNLPRGMIRIFITNEEFGGKLSDFVGKERKKSPKCVMLEKPL